MIYSYQKENSPNLDALEASINLSIFVDAYNYLRWDADDTYLKIYLHRELNTVEKTLLDGLVLLV